MVEFVELIELIKLIELIDVPICRLYEQEAAL